MISFSALTFETMKKDQKNPARVDLQGAGIDLVASGTDIFNSDCNT
jgi:hypothetical protein